MSHQGNRLTVGARAFVLVLMLAAVRLAAADNAEWSLLSAAAPTDSAAGPGLRIKPVGGVWDLSAYGYVEVKVANDEREAAEIEVRIDDSAGLITDAFNRTQQRVAAGATATYRVYLNFSRNGTNYPLAPAKISQVRISINGRTDTGKVRVLTLVAGGKPGALPADYLPLVKPVAGVLLAATSDFTAGVLLQGKGAQVHLAPAEAGQTVVISTVEKAGDMQGVFVGPKRGLWSLIDYTRVQFQLFNPGAQPVTVVCQVNNVEWAKGAAASAPTVIPAHSRATVEVPFFTDKVWDGTQKTAAQLRISDAASEKMIEEKASDGQLLLNDQVSGVSVYVQGASLQGVAQEVHLEAVTALTSPPAVLAEWCGKRPPVAGEWTQTLDDSFDGKALNTAVWTPRNNMIGYIPNEVQRYREGNVTVDDGMLHIRSERLRGVLYDNPAWGLPTREYTSGALTSYNKWTQRYGYFEARMKMPVVGGLWPAFWMMPDRGSALGDAQKAKGVRGNTDVDGMEFDIMEHLNRLGPTRFNIACHWDGYGKDHKKCGTGRIYAPLDAEGFITTGLLWEPGKASWYYNGNLVGTWSSPRVSTVPEYLILVTQMGGWEGFDIDDALLPAEVLVDYVRVWQNKAWAELPAAKAP